ncbi:MAG: hypothetical protein ABH950_08395 [Candidatus Altiarchaeota archaeon]
MKEQTPKQPDLVGRMLTVLASGDQAKTTALGGLTGGIKELSGSDSPTAPVASRIVDAIEKGQFGVARLLGTATPETHKNISLLANHFPDDEITRALGKGTTEGVAELQRRYEAEMAQRASEAEFETRRRELIEGIQKRFEKGHPLETIAVANPDFVKTCTEADLDKFQDTSKRMIDDQTGGALAFALEHINTTFGKDRSGEAAKRILFVMKSETLITHLSDLKGITSSGTQSGHNLTFTRAAYLDGIGEVLAQGSEDDVNKTLGKRLKGLEGKRDKEIELRDKLKDAERSDREKIRKSYLELGMGLYDAGAEGETSLNFLLAASPKALAAHSGVLDGWGDFISENVGQVTAINGLGEADRKGKLADRLVSTKTGSDGFKHLTKRAIGYDLEGGLTQHERDIYDRMLPAAGEALTLDFAQKRDAIFTNPNLSDWRAGVTTENWAKLVSDDLLDTAAGYLSGETPQTEIVDKIMARDPRLTPDTIQNLHVLTPELLPLTLTHAGKPTTYPLAQMTAGLAEISDETFRGQMAEFFNPEKLTEAEPRRSFLLSDEDMPAKFAALVRHGDLGLVDSMFIHAGKEDTWPLANMMLSVGNISDPGLRTSAAALLEPTKLETNHELRGFLLEEGNQIQWEKLTKAKDTQLLAKVVEVLGGDDQNKLDLARIGLIGADHPELGKEYADSISFIVEALTEDGGKRGALSALIEKINANPRNVEDLTDEFAFGKDEPASPTGGRPGAAEAPGLAEGGAPSIPLTPTSVPDLVGAGLLTPEESPVVTDGDTSKKGEILAYFSGANGTIASSVERVYDSFGDKDALDEMFEQKIKPSFQNLPPQLQDDADLKARLFISMATHPKGIDDYTKPENFKAAISIANLLHGIHQDSSLQKFGPYQRRFPNGATPAEVLTDIFSVTPETFRSLTKKASTIISRMKTAEESLLSKRSEMYKRKLVEPYKLALVSQPSALVGLTDPSFLAELVTFDKSVPPKYVETFLEKLTSCEECALVLGQPDVLKEITRFSEDGINPEISMLPQLFSLPRIKRGEIVARCQRAITDGPVVFEGRRTYVTRTDVSLEESRSPSTSRRAGPKFGWRERPEIELTYGTRRFSFPNPMIGYPLEIDPVIAPYVGGLNYLELRGTALNSLEARLEYPELEIMKVVSTLIPSRDEQERMASVQEIYELMKKHPILGDIYRHKEEGHEDLGWRFFQRDVENLRRKGGIELIGERQNIQIPLSLYKDEEIEYLHTGREAFENYNTEALAFSKDGKRTQVEEDIELIGARGKKGDLKRRQSLVITRLLSNQQNQMMSPIDMYTHCIAYDREHTEMSLFHDNSGKPMTSTSFGAIVRDLLQEDILSRLDVGSYGFQARYFRPDYYPKAAYPSQFMAAKRRTNMYGSVRGYSAGQRPHRTVSEDLPIEVSDSIHKALLRHTLRGEKGEPTSRELTTFQDRVTLINLISRCSLQMENCTKLETIHNLRDVIGETQSKIDTLLHLMVDQGLLVQPDTGYYQIASEYKSLGSEPKFDEELNQVNKPDNMAREVKAASIVESKSYHSTTQAKNFTDAVDVYFEERSLEDREAIKKLGALISNMSISVPMAMRPVDLMDLVREIARGTRDELPHPKSVSGHLGAMIEGAIPRKVDLTTRPRTKADNDSLGLQNNYTVIDPTTGEVSFVTARSDGQVDVETRGMEIPPILIRIQRDYGTFYQLNPKFLDFVGSNPAFAPAEPEA